MNEDVSNVEYLGEVRKSPAQVLKVSVGTYLGRAYVYTTIWTKDEQDPGMGEATRMGLTLRPDTLRDLLPLLEAALKVAKARKPERPGRR